MQSQIMFLTVTVLLFCFGCGGGNPTPPQTGNTQGPPVKKPQKVDQPDIKKPKDNANEGMAKLPKNGKVASKSEPEIQLEFSSKGDLLVTGIGEKPLRVFDIEKGTPLRTLTGLPGNLSAITLSRDSTRIAAASTTGFVKFWNGVAEEGLDEYQLANLKSEEQRPPFKAHDAPVHALSIHPQFSHLATGSDDGMMRIWRLPFADPWELTGHNQSITAIETNEGKQIAVSGSSGGAVRLWNLEPASRGLLAELGQLPSQVTSIAISNDQRYIAAGDALGLIRLWDMQQQPPASQDLAAHQKAVTGLSFKKQSNQLVSSSLDGTMKQWQFPFTPPKVIAESATNVALLAVSEDGKQFAYSTIRGEIFVSKLVEKANPRKLSQIIPDLTQLHLSRDGRILVTAARSGRVTVLQTGDEKIVAEFAAHNGSVRHLAGSPDGKLLATTSTDGEVGIWSPTQKSGGTAGPQQASFATYARDRKTRFVGLANGSIEVQNASTGKTTRTIPGHDATIESITLDKNDKWVISSDVNGFVRVWDQANNRLVTELGAHSASAVGAFLTGNSDRLWTASSNGRLKSWKWPVPVAKNLATTDESVSAVAGSPDGKTVCFATKVGAVFSMPIGTSDVQTSLGNAETEITFLEITQDGQVVAVGKSGEIFIGQTGQPDSLKQVISIGTEVSHSRVSPDGQKLALVRSDNVAQVIELKVDTQKTLQKNSNAISAVSISPTNGQIATAEDDFSIAIRNASGQTLRKLTGHTGQVSQIVWSTDGKQLASHSADGSVRVWGEAETQAKSTFEIANAKGVSFINNNAKVAIGMQDGSIEVRTLADNSSQTIAAAQAHQQAISGIVSTGKETFATASSDGTVKLWNASSLQATSTINVGNSVSKLVALEQAGRVITLDSRNKLATWNMENGQRTAEVTLAPGTTISDLSIAKSFVVALTNERKILWWDARLRRIAATKSLVSSASGIAGRADASEIVVSGKDGSVASRALPVLWTTPSDNETTGICWGQDTGSILVNDSQSGLSEISLDTGKIQKTFQITVPGIIQIENSNRPGEIILAQKNAVSIWNLSDETMVRTASVPRGVSRLNSVAGPSQALMTHTQGGRSLIDTSTWQLLQTWKLNANAAASVLPGAGLLTAISGQPIQLTPFAFEKVETSHSSQISVLQPVPGTDQFITAGGDGRVVLWSSTGEMVREVIKAGSAITTLVISVNGQKLVTADSENRVISWNFSDGKQLQQYQFEGQASSLAITSSGDAVAIATEKGVRVVEFTDGKLIKDIASEHAADHVLFGEDRTRVLAFHLKQKSNVEEPFLVKKFKASDAELGGLEFLSEESLATLSKQGDVTLWNPTTGEQVKSLPKSRELSTHLAKTTDGKRLIGFSQTGLSVWDLSKEEPPAFAPLSVQGTRFSIDPDGKKASIITGDNRIHRIDARTGHILERLRHHAGTVLFAVSAGQSDVILSVGADRKILRSTGNLEKSTLKLNEGIAQFCSAQKLGLNAIMGPGGTLKILGPDWKEARELTGATPGMTHIDINEDGTRMATVSANGNSSIIELWDLATRNRKHQITSEGLVQDLRFNQTGSLLLVAFKNKTVQIYEVDSGRMLQQVATQELPTKAVFAINDNAVITGSPSGRIRAYLLPLEFNLKAHDGAVSTVKFTTQGDHILSGGSDGVVRLWSLSSGQQLRQFKGAATKINDVALSSTGEYVVASCEDGSARIWPVFADVIDPDNVRPTSILEHKEPLKAVSVSPNGKLIATGGADKQVRVWDQLSGELLAHFEGHAGTVKKLAFQPSGDQLVSTGTDYRVRKWEVPASQTTGQQVVLEKNSLQNLALNAAESTTQGETLTKQNLMTPLEAIEKQVREAETEQQRRNLRDQLFRERLEEKKSKELARASTVEQRQQIEERYRQLQQSALSNEQFDSLSKQIEALELELEKELPEAQKTALLSKLETLKEKQRNAQRAINRIASSIDGNDLTDNHENLIASLYTEFSFVSNVNRPVHLLVSNDGRYVVGAQQAAKVDDEVLEGVVQAWDVQYGIEKRIWKDLKNDAIRGISFSDDEQTIYTFPDLHIYHLPSGRSKALTRRSVQAISHDGKRVAVGLRGEALKDSPVIKLYDANTFEELPQKFSWYEASVTALAFTPDDRYLAICLRERSLHRLMFVDPETMQVVRFKVGPDKDVSFLEEVVHDQSWLEKNSLPGISFLKFSDRAPGTSETQPVLLVTHGRYPEIGYTLKIWRLDDPQNWDKETVEIPKLVTNVSNRQPFFRHREMNPIQFINNEFKLVYKSASGIGRLDVLSGRPPVMVGMKGTKGKQLVYAIAENGKWLAYGDEFGRAYLQNLQYGGQPFGLTPGSPAHKGPIMGMAFSKNHQYLVTSGEENRIKVWSLERLMQKFNERYAEFSKRTK